MSNQNKNTIDSQLFVNCTFDMDYLEITKNESLRKYEENVFLLGNIFTNKLEDEDESMSDDESSDDLDQGQDEVLQLFSGQSDMQIDQIVAELSQDKSDEKINILLSQVECSVKDLKEHETLLKNNKTNFKENTGKFNDLYQRLKTFKSVENENYFNEVLKQADDIGILSETYKQVDNSIRGRHRYNCELPFDVSDNIVIMPL